MHGTTDVHTQHLEKPSTPMSLCPLLRDKTPGKNLFELEKDYILPLYGRLLRL